MPSWGWFVVALIVVDVAVVITWFALRRRSARTQFGPAVDRHPVDEQTNAEVCRLVKSRKTVQAIALLRENTGMSLRQAKDVVDAGCAADRSATLRDRQSAENTL